MTIILDACAIIAYIRKEEGATIVETLLIEKKSLCYVHALNICEVYYDILRVDGEAVARAAIADIESAGVVIVETIERELWQLASQLKARNRLSLADCIALALAMRLQAELLTSDHHEFDKMSSLGIYPIKFIR